MAGFKKIINEVNDFVDRLNQDRIGVYAAQAAFFIFVSIVPFLLLLTQLVSLILQDVENIYDIINSTVPSYLSPLVATIFDDLTEDTSFSFLSIATITAIWASSRGMLALISGMSEIYKTNQKRRYLVARGLSIIYTVAFIIILVITFGFIVLGNYIFEHIAVLIPWIGHLKPSYDLLRYTLPFLILTLSFIVVFKMGNRKKTKVKKVFPGSVLTALAWIIFSSIYSVYVSHSSNLTSIYGSVGMIVILLLWLYFLIYIFFIGAELNIWLHPEMAGRDADSSQENALDNENSDSISFNESDNSKNSPKKESNADKVEKNPAFTVSKKT